MFELSDKVKEGDIVASFSRLFITSARTIRNTRELKGK
jgi:hypothetical protein